MPRYKHARKIRGKYSTKAFGRLSVPPENNPVLTLGVDELEAIRLKDIDGLDQQEAAARMGISRATYQRILKSARKKVAAALLKDAVLVVNVRHPYYINCPGCGAGFYSDHGFRRGFCPSCGHGLTFQIRHNKGGDKMKVAFSSSDGKTISAHFGRSRYFVVYEIENGAIVNQETRENPHAKEAGQHHHHEEGHHHHGHGWMQRVLGDCDVVITRGLGQGTYNSLTGLGIEVYVVEEKSMEEVLRKLNLIN